MPIEYLALGASLAALLLSLCVWIDAQRIKRRAASILAWHEQQRTVERGGMVISVEVNPQPTSDHRHVLTMQHVRARHHMQRGELPSLN